MDVISPVHMPPPSLCSFHYSVQFCSLLCEGGRSCGLWSNTGPPHTCYLLSHVQLCDPMDCNLCPWDSPGKNTGVGGHCLLQGIFPSQGLNLGQLNPRHQCSSRLLTVLLGTLWSSIKQIEAPYVFGKAQLLWTQCRGIGPHLAARRKLHGFSRVAAGTWGIFSSYGGDVHSKVEFVQ